MNGSNPPRIGPFAIQLRAALDASAGAGPVHERLATTIREMIDRGELLPGTRLPPERALAHDLGIGRNTVVRAYGALRRDRFVDRHQGRGTAVRGDPSVATSSRLGDLATSSQRSVVFRTLSDAPSGVIDLLSASPPPNERITAMMRSALQKVPLEELAMHHGYYPLGYPELRKAIAIYLQRTGLRTSEDEILVTAGAQQAITLLSNWIVDGGGKVAVENPTYAGAIDAVRAANGRVVALPQLVSEPALDELEESIAVGGVGAVYVTPTFQNPTGVLMPEFARRRLAMLARSTRTVVIEDHGLAAMRITTEPIPRPIAAFAAADAPVVFVGSLSKSVWGGLRIGWIRAPRSLVIHLARLRASADLAGSFPAQAMAVDLVDRLDEVYEIRHRELVARLELIGAWLRELLPSWHWIPPQGGLSIWARLPYGSSTELAASASRRGVAIVAGSVLSPEGDYDDHVRLPIGVDAAQTREGLTRLARAWRDYERSFRPHGAVVV
jgi:DNA-binding transcriptional MocR family regulator